MNTWRQNEFGKRPVRIANCSGYCGDPPDEMYKQAALGDVDFITGDYLAEVNMAKNAQDYAAGRHPGYEASAWEGFKLSIDVINSKRIKVAINGGALDPGALAVRVSELVREKGYNLSVAYVSGDNVVEDIRNLVTDSNVGSLAHLDSSSKQTERFTSLADLVGTPADIVSANAYLGARSIVTAFQHGADIVIAGRVSDASPVIAAAWYWWSWAATDYNQLAGSLIAGHLIECSAYVTGGNFAGATDVNYADASTWLHPGFPIAEINSDGSCVITKHDETGGLVDHNTVKCQLLYELQGDVYLHSDSKALLEDVMVKTIGTNRVRVSGVKGQPPPPTTKLAVFYKAGFECQLLLNASGYGWQQKCDLFEAQVRLQLGAKTLERLDILEFQLIGIPATDPQDQNSSTMYIRLVAQSKDSETLVALSQAVQNISLRHFSGFHSSLDMRTAVPKPYIAYYPVLWEQDALREMVHLIDSQSGVTTKIDVGHPPAYEELTERHNYDTNAPITLTGPTKTIRLGDVVLARSGDKGSNLNVGFFVRKQEQWDWLRTFLSRERVWQLLGKDADPSYYIERVEMPRIFAVHFVVYGILGRGVSSSTRLDTFGKGFADYVRDKLVEVPVDIL